MDNELRNVLYEKGAEIVRFVDISGLSAKQTQGFPKAIVLCMSLSEKFIADMYGNLQTERDEYLEKEKKVEKLADWLAEYIWEKGYRAYSQSQKNNFKNGYLASGFVNPKIQLGISVLPQKAIAWLGGLGFIGKNNLLVTEDYGCALTMCSVLTDAPVLTESYHQIAPQCGECDVCVKICPARAIHGNEWTQNGGREALVDVSKCSCALKCMVNCPWTLRYAKK